MYRVLLVEKDVDWNRQILEYFRARNLEMVSCHDHIDGRKRFREEHFDALLLNQKDAFRERQYHYPERIWIRLQRIPVILFSHEHKSADSRDLEKIQADCCLQPPYSVEELYDVFIRKMFDYYGNRECHFIHCKELYIYSRTRELAVNYKLMRLARKEYEVLRFLMENTGVAVSRDEILNHVWGIDYFGDDRVVDTHIKKLRKKLGIYGRYIKTLYKIGYMLKDSDVV